MISFPQLANLEYSRVFALPILKLLTACRADSESDCQSMTNLVRLLRRISPKARTIAYSSAVKILALSEILKIFVLSLLTAAEDTLMLSFKPSIMKKVLRGDANIACCIKAEPKIFARANPLSGGAGQPKFNQLEMVTIFTYKPSLVRIDGRNFELSW